MSWSYPAWRTGYSLRSLLEEGWESQPWSRAAIHTPALSLCWRKGSASQKVHFCKLVHLTFKHQGEGKSNSKNNTDGSWSLIPQGLAQVSSPWGRAGTLTCATAAWRCLLADKAHPQRCALLTSGVSRLSCGHSCTWGFIPGSCSPAQRSRGAAAPSAAQAGGHWSLLSAITSHWVQNEN